MKKSPWKILSSKIEYNHPYAKIKRDICLNKKNEKIDYVTILSNNYVVILPLLNKFECLYLNQYRHSINKWINCFPAGYIDKGEIPKESAKRELLEETGFLSNKFILLKSIYPVPGRLNNKGYFFVALNCKKICAPKFEKAEEIKIKRIKMNSLIKKAISKNFFADADFYCMLYFYNKLKSKFLR